MQVVYFIIILFIAKEKFEDTKRLIRTSKSKKDRQQNGQAKKDKRTNNDLQNITHKTKDRVTRTPLKTGMNLFLFLFHNNRWSI